MAPRRGVTQQLERQPQMLSRPPSNHSILLPYVRRVVADNVKSEVKYDNKQTKTIQKNEKQKSGNKHKAPLEDFSDCSLDEGPRPFSEYVSAHSLAVHSNFNVISNKKQVQ